MSQNFHLESLVDRFNRLSQTTFGQELIATIGEYIRYNQSIKITANKMHIHRNTLNHRLLSIKKIFELDPHNTFQLITLYIAYL
ncbi:helix-turn-helix domain-containing protein [Ligilactobacillus sp. LYQ139]